MIFPRSLIVVALTCCGSAAPDDPREGPTRARRSPPEHAPPMFDARGYPWLDGDIEASPLHEAFPPPDGYVAVPLEENSFGAFLRGLPIRRDRTHVLSHTGRVLKSPSAAVVVLDVGEKNLQQCADSILRLHAEWSWQAGRQDDVAYHFTNGAPSRWSAWRRGQRLRIRNNEVERLQGRRRASDHAEFRRYLEHLFIYAGTSSLAFDSKPVDPEDVQPGDFFVDPGSPGHAVLVLDVAQNLAGRRVALLGQGFMPAQEFHVIASADPSVVERVWFRLPTSKRDVLRTPSWRAFDGSQLRRFTLEARPRPRE